MWICKVKRHIDDIPNLTLFWRLVDRAAADDGWEAVDAGEDSESSDSDRSVGDGEDPDSATEGTDEVNTLGEYHTQCLLAGRQVGK